MASPAKRRKKNDLQSSPQPNRSLDYFFGKQKQKGELKPSQTAWTLESPQVAETASTSGTTAPELTDEELARKLQEEWNNEAKTTAGDVQSIETNGKVDHGIHIRAETPKEELPTLSNSEKAPSGRREKATLSLQSVVSTEDAVTLGLPFDENPLTFEPRKYIPDLQRSWAGENGDASYGLLTRAFVLVNSTSSRIKIVDTLVNMLRVLIEANPDSLLPAVSSPVLLSSIARLTNIRSGSLQIQFHLRTFL